MIQIQHLTKRFAAAGATVVALNDINLEIQDGDIYGIIGMSGAGPAADAAAGHFVGYVYKGGT